MKKIKIGILGCANIAERFIIPFLKENPKFEVVAVASRDEEKSKSLSEKFECKGLSSYNSLFDEDIQAVYIPLPNSLHFEWVKKAIEHKKHILVEKSLGVSLQEVEYLNNFAKFNQVALVESFQFRFHKQLSKILELMKSNTIGDIRAINSSFGFPPFPDKHNIRYKKELGGGALLDAGAYPVKITQLLLGNNIKVSSAKLFYDAELKIDLWGSAFIESNISPICSKISFGFDNYYQCNVDIWGSKGKISANRIFTSPPESDAVIYLENEFGKQEILIPKDNHFLNLHNYFYDLIQSNNFEEEYYQNINQARLIQEIRNLSYE